MSIETPPFNCPAGNICQVTAAEAPVCGTDPEHLWPILPAEAVCINALQNYWGELTDRRPDPASAVAVVRSQYMTACRDIELAASPYTSAAEAAALFDTASDRLEASADRSKLRLDHHVMVQNLLAHMPAFESRRPEITLSEDEIEETLSDIQKDLAGILQDIEDAPVHTFDNGVLCRSNHGPCVNNEIAREHNRLPVAVQLLATRDGEFCYPTLPREMNRVRNQPAYEHNLYLLNGAGDKVPIRLINLLRNPANVPEDVLAVDYYGLVESASRQVHEEGAKVSYSIMSDHIGWLIAEAKGEPLEPSQKRFLDLMGDNFFAQVDAYSETIEHE